MTARTVYDELPYDCAPIPLTAPPHLGLISALAGGPRPPVDRYSMLEIGCGDGANLLPLAFHNPQSTFVGVDASKVQIDMAVEGQKALGLTNVRFIAEDVRRLDGVVTGVFDYVASHGVYSWVPKDARDAIWKAFSRHLAEGGLGYLSYNTHPGWKMRGLVRDVLLRAAKGGSDLRDRARRARARAADLKGAIGEAIAKHPYPALLAGELDIVLRASVPYLVHEYLSEENEPIYFADFVDLARSHGLDYVGEALNRREEAEGVEDQQMGDVLGNRQFRASVLRRKGSSAGPRPGLAIVSELYAASALAVPNAPPKLDPGEAETYKGTDDAEVNITSPLSKAAIRVLSARSPAGVAFPDLVALSSGLLRDHGVTAPPTQADAERLRRDLMLLFRAGQGELRIVPGPLGRAAPAEGPLPAATALARFEAERRGLLTSPLHTTITTSDVERLIVSALDGKRSLDAILPPLLARVAAGSPPLSLGGSAITDRAVVEPVLRAVASRFIAKLSSHNLLEFAENR